jgi:hypothetical protein
MSKQHGMLRLPKGDRHILLRGPRTTIAAMAPGQSPPMQPN